MGAAEGIIAHVARQETGRNHIPHSHDDAQHEEAYDNAMGPSYVDPRSGEILVADVIWYHNVISLVHDWRFVQTGAVDPRVRTEVFRNFVDNLDKEVKSARRSYRLLRWKPRQPLCRRLVLF